MDMLNFKKYTLADVFQYNSEWGIKRFKSEKDQKEGRIYCPEEAKKAFCAPQFSHVRGGIKGAVSNVGILLTAIKAGRPLPEICNRFKHLFKGNLLLNEGINELCTILASASSGTKFDNTNAYLGVGDDTTTESASQTGLQAAVNKLYKVMDTGYPTYGTSQQIVWRSTFGSAEANFDWREFTVANGSSDAADNLNRKVSSQGTKASGQVWEVSMTITLS